MKKTFSRAFSLLLVLALLVSVIPSALADNSLQITGGSSVAVGSEITLTATGVPEGAEAEWKWTASSTDVSIQPNGNTCKVTGVNIADEIAITATATVASTDGQSAPSVYTATVPVQVTGESVEAIGIEITNGTTATVVYGDTLQLNAVLTPEGATSKVAWSSSDSTIASVSDTGLVTGVKAGGPVTITATANGHSDTISITVAKKSLTASITGASSPLKINEQKTLGIDLGVSNVTPTITWKSSDDSVLSVTDKGVIKALKAGKATITATVTLVHDNYVLEGADSNNTVVVKTSEITVGDTVVNYTAYKTSIKSGTSESATITPYIEDKDLPSGATSSSIVYKASIKTSTGTATAYVNSTGSTFTVSNGSGEGTVKVTIEAYYQDAKIGEVTVTIGVYQEHSIIGTVASGHTTFDFDDGVFSTLTRDKMPIVNKSLYSALLGNEAYLELKLAPSTTNVYMTFSSHNAVRNSVDDIKVTLKGNAGTQAVSYTWYGEDNVIVATGSMNITVGETDADIIYSTSYNKNVIFDDSDFTKFWNEQVSNRVVSGTLSYITFEDINTGTYPRYGKLYRDTSCSYRVTTDLKFTTSSKTGYYLLDNVTYKPDSTVTYPVTVQIPFTAVGTNGDRAYGMIAIDINQESTTITSYGVQFGNGTNSIADYIADTYKANTGDTLNYVTFPSLTASTGKLLYDFSGVLDSREVLSSYKFYYNGNSKDLDLEDVVFVPRAGLYGEVTLYYYAYNASGGNEYKGTIVLNVQQKTKSAEFSDVGTSYSWAADSVDFLSYEGIAQGSNGKYRPTANITRGDFMLMLYRAFLEDEHKNDSITSNFSDVTKGSDTYSKETYQAVGVAKKLGIAQGTNGKFNPKSYITRQEAMTLIYRTLDEVNYDLEYTVSTSTSSFKDYSSVASYAKTAISDLIGHGIVIGNNSKINPTSNITRAEMAVILHRVLTY